MLPVNVARHGTVRPEQDARAPCRIEDAVRLRRDLRLRTAIEHIRCEIAESAEQSVLRENLSSLLKGNALDDRRPVDRLDIVGTIPVQRVAVSRIAADMEDIVAALGVCRAQDFLFSGSEYLLVDRAARALADEVLQAEVDARHARLGDDAARQLREIARDDIERRAYRRGVLADELCEKCLILGECPGLHEFHRRARTEEIIECGDLVSVPLRDLLRIGDLPRKEGVVVGQRLHLRQFLCRACGLHDGVRIGEEPVRHDLYEIRLKAVDIAQFPIQKRLLKTRVGIGIGVNLIREKVEPESRRDTLDLPTVHRAEDKLLF